MQIHAHFYFNYIIYYCLLIFCCHAFIMANPGNLATCFGNITQLIYVFDGKDIKYRSAFIYAKKPLQNMVFKMTKA